MKTDKRTHKFNFFDVIICVAFAICVALVTLKFTYFDKKSAMQDQAVIEFTVYNIMQETAQAGSSGDVFLQKDDIKVGSVMNASVEANMIYTEKEDGTASQTENPLGKKNLTGRMTLSGTAESNGFFVGDVSRITVGGTLPVYILDPATGNGCAVEITVDSIRLLTSR